jgi:hypothetical protein
MAGINISDRDARAVIIRAYQNQGWALPSITEMQGIQAFFRAVSGYGEIFIKENRSDGESAENNWGVVRISKETSENRGVGSIFWYHTPPRSILGDHLRLPVKTYQNDIEGISDCLSLLYFKLAHFHIRSALATGDAGAFAYTLVTSNYLLGSGKKIYDRVDSVAKAITKNAYELASNLGEPAVIKRGAGDFAAKLKNEKESSGEEKEAKEDKSSIVPAMIVSGAVALAAYQIYKTKKEEQEEEEDI